MIDQLRRTLQIGALLGALLPGALGRSERGHAGTEGAFGRTLRRGSPRLPRATGPGSYNEEAEMKALIVDGKEREAAEYYETCLNINYRAGKPKMRWGSVWYATYKARRAALRMKLGRPLRMLSLACFTTMRATR